MKELLSLVMKESYVIFNGQCYKLVDGIAMDSPLGLTLVNVSLVYFQKNCLKNCPSDFKTHYYWRYVDNIFVLFTSPKHLEAFRNFLNCRHVNFYLQLKVKSKTECPFLMYRLFTKIELLPLISTVSLQSVAFMHILAGFYHIPIPYTYTCLHTRL